MQTPSPSRRTVLRTAAWSVPAVSLATASPAFATSNTLPPVDCTPVLHSINWEQGAANADKTHFTVTSTLPAGVDRVDPVQIDIYTTYGANTVSDGRNYSFVNLNQTDKDLGITNAIKFAQDKPSGATNVTSSMTVTVVFSEAVTGLQATITDIDCNGNPANNNTSQADRVWISQVAGDKNAGFRNPAKGANVLGKGTPTDPWYNTTGNSGDSAVTGNVRIEFDGAVTSFTFVYENYAKAVSSTTLNLGGITFTTQAEGCAV